jgi:molybdopterin synthase sulfur carrier subunit
VFKEKMKKSITLRYFASLQEQTQKSTETMVTELETYRELYSFLAAHYGFLLSPCQIKVAVNDEFEHLDQPILNQATIVFIPPVAGG